MEVIGQIKSCSKCSRHILVEQVMFGISHALKTLVICWDCLEEKKKDWARKKYKLGGEK